MSGAWLRRAIFVLAFVGLSFAPIFPRLIEVRAQVVGHGGDVVTNRWSFDSLWSSWQNLQYARPKERAALFLAIDAVVCASLAGLVARAAASRLGRGGAR